MQVWHFRAILIYLSLYAAIQALNACRRPECSRCSGLLANLALLRALSLTPPLHDSVYVELIGEILLWQSSRRVLLNMILLAETNRVARSIMQLDGLESTLFRRSAQIILVVSFAVIKRLFRQTGVSFSNIRLII